MPSSSTKLLVASGSLRGVSYARPAKLFTANQNLITSQVGNLRADALRSIAEAVANILKVGRIA